MTFEDKYRVIRPLGNQKKRKFNAVYLVENTITHENAVLKFNSKTSKNGHLQDRLREEATFQFAHPGLPEVLDFFETETEQQLVLSFKQGIPLPAMLEKVPQKEKTAFFLRLLQELQPLFEELTQKHVIHLDIKPSNIILDGTHTDFTVSLIDFGMAINTTSANRRPTLFPLGYAAPELLLNRLELVDQRTDLFALGIVTWQGFTGKLPLMHPHPALMTNLQITHPLPQDSSIPKPVFRILERMCFKHSFKIPPNQLPVKEMDALLVQAMENRYQTIEEVIEDWKQLPERKKWFRRK